MLLLLPLIFQVMCQNRSRCIITIEREKKENHMEKMLAIADTLGCSEIICTYMYVTINYHIYLDNLSCNCNIFC